jgi:hypothetical protein
MNLSISTHHLEHLIWLQTELRTQDAEGAENPVYNVIEYRPDGVYVCRDKFLTRVVAQKFIATRTRQLNPLTIVVTDGSENPEIRFLRELILGIDLTGIAAPRPAAPAVVPPLPVPPYVPPVPYVPSVPVQPSQGTLL